MSGINPSNWNGGMRELHYEFYMKGNEISINLIWYA
jgi:hypothetical protein